MARGICLKRHRFQSVDTKPETGAPALAGRGGVVRVCVFCGSSSQRQSGGSVVWVVWLARLSTSCLQPWSLCFPRSWAGGLGGAVRLGGSRMETISDGRVTDLVKRMNPSVEVSHCYVIPNGTACSAREECICPSLACV